MLPPETIHLPFEPGAFRMALGLQAAPEDALVEIDALYPAELARRRALLEARHAEVFAALPGTEEAGAAALARVATALARTHPALFAFDGARIDNRLTGESWNLARPDRHPLEIAGRLTQEDWCLIALDRGVPVLVAAVLCFPSRWVLAEKIGRPLADVHGPVPLYAERLAPAVDRFFRALRPGRIVIRHNWSFSDTPDLFLPGAHGTGLDPRVTDGNAGERLFLRVERQSLSALERCPGDHVLFGIRVHVTPLARAVARPADAARLAEAVRALPDSMAGYKGVPPVRAALLGWLDRAAERHLEEARA